MATKQTKTSSAVAAATTSTKLAPVVVAAKCPAGYVPAIAIAMGQPPKKPYRGARNAWHTAFVAYHKQHAAKPQGGSQPVVLFSTWAAAMQASPPSTPKTGKLAGQCEPPIGWLNWFVRAGHATKVACWVPAPTS